MGLIIFFGIITLIMVLLLCSVRVEFEYKGDIWLRVSYLCFTIFKYPAEKKKTKKKDKEDKRLTKDAVKAAADAASDTSTGASEKADETGQPSEKSDPPKKNSSPKKEEKPAKKKLTLGEIFEVAKLIFDSLGKPLKKLLKRTQIHHLRINIVCGGEDAAKAAINFGKTNILVGNALGWLGSFFTLKPADDIHIDVNFYREETAAEASFVIKTSVLTALVFLFTLLGRAVRYYQKNPKAAQAVRKMI